jgi:preprotein translocase subunit SecA
LRIIENTKAANDFKTFEFDLIRYFSITSPISEIDFAKLLKWVTGKCTKALKYYNAKKCDRRRLSQSLKNIFKQDNQFERIVVPFTDGVKSLN